MGKQRIMIVEDDLDLQILLKNLFKAEYDITLCENGLEGLKAHYHELQQVNASMAKRLAEISAHDAKSNGDSSVNALVLLDVFAQSMPDSIDAQLEELRPAFQALA